jgi:hypothetical protein
MTMVDDAIDALRGFGVQLDALLSRDELQSVEARFGFKFAPDTP